MLRGFRNQPAVALDDVALTRRVMAWGTLLMQKLLAYGNTVGLTKIFDDIPPADEAMLALCRRLGFSERRDANAPTVIHAE